MTFDPVARVRGAALVLGPDNVCRTVDPNLMRLFGELNDRYYEGSLPLVPVCRGIPPDHGELEDLNGLTRLQGLRGPGAPPRFRSRFTSPTGCTRDRLPLRRADGRRSPGRCSMRWCTWLFAWTSSERPIPTRTATVHTLPPSAIG